MEEANYLLNHRHFLTGVVEHGKELGRRIGTPTANLRLPRGVLTPAFGVYAAEVVLEDGRRYMAVTNIGTCPTLEEDIGITVESWLMDFHENLYGKTIRVEFCRFLRPEQKFDSLEDLKNRIHLDARQTREYFAR